MCFLYVSAYVRMHIPFQVMPKQVGELERVSRVSMSQSPPKLKLPTYYIFVVNEVKLLLTIGIEICECYYVNCSLFYYFPDTRTLSWVLLLTTGYCSCMLYAIATATQTKHGTQLTTSCTCLQRMRVFWHMCVYADPNAIRISKRPPILYCMHKCTCT